MPHPDRLLVEVTGNSRPAGSTLVWRLRDVELWVPQAQPDALRRAVKCAAALAVALLWLAAVALLAHGLVSWWAELESNATAAGVVPGAPFPYLSTLE